MICPKCGAALASDVKFCNVCGAPQEQKPQQPQMKQPVYQQPTYAQQVYQDRQTAMQYAESEHAPAKAEKPKKKFPIMAVIIPAAVVLVCALVLVLIFAFGKKTVYLMTENVVETQTNIVTYTYEYTEDGKLAYYGYELEYKEEYAVYMDSDGLRTSATYSYDKKGLPETVEFEINGKTYEYEYVYDKDGDLKGLEGDGQEFKVKCDDAGRITSVKSDGDESFSAKYSYYDDGVVKKASIRSSGSELEYRYNEQGQLTETTSGYNGTLYSASENKYDEDGRVVENVAKTYSYGELVQTTTVSYTYEDGLPVTYELEIEMDEGSVTLVFETEDEGLERLFVFADLKVKGMDEADVFAEEDMEMLEKLTVELAYDEYGNMTGSVMKAVDGGEEVVVSGQSTSYEAVKVPRNFVMNYQAPIYFLQIDATRSAPKGDRPAADAPAETQPMTEAVETPADAPASPY